MNWIDENPLLHRLRFLWLMSGLRQWISTKRGYYTPRSPWMPSTSRLYWIHADKSLRRGYYQTIEEVGIEARFIDRYVAAHGELPPIYAETGVYSMTNPDEEEVFG